MKIVQNIVIFLICFSGLAQNEELFSEANEAYRNGNYEEAIATYESILENGEASAAVYYNLGNSHYKLDHIAPSIYYFEKALQLKPGDEDIQNNIAFARNMTLDDIEVIEDTGFSSRFSGFLSNFSLSGWAWFSILFSVLFTVFFILYYRSSRPIFKRTFLSVAGLSLLLCLLCVTLGFQQKSFQEGNDFGVIFSENVQVKEEPSVRGNNSFELHEGTKTKILEEYQDWSRIELANGAQGWIESNHLKKL